MASFCKLFGSIDESSELNHESVDLKEEETDDVPPAPESGGDGKRSHSRLMESIASLDSKKRQKMAEPAAEGEISALNCLGPDGSFSSQGVKVSELIGTLGNTPSNTQLKKQLQNVQRNQKVLDAPLHKLQKDKFERTVAYKASSEEVSKWDEIVQKNRKAEHLSFPLNQTGVKIQTTSEFVNKFKPSTPLEQEVYKILHGSKHNETCKKLQSAEEEAYASMSLKEAQERRAEQQKVRARLSYYEAKCHRKKKIKSKVFHRIQRKNKAKVDAEELTKKISASPEESKALLDNLDKARAKERLTLKHRNTGKWAKGMTRFGKYDNKVRDLVAEQLQRSHELTKKPVGVEDISNDKNESLVDDYENGDDGSVPKVSLSDINNPWFTGNTSEGEVQKTDQPEIVALKPTSKGVISTKMDSDDDNDNDDDDNNNDDDNDNDNDNANEGSTCSGEDELSDEEIINTPSERTVRSKHLKEPSIKHQPTKENIRELGIHMDIQDETREVEDVKQSFRGIPATKSDSDLSKVLTANATSMQSTSPGLIVEEDGSLDAGRQHRVDIQEAFAEDDIIKEFQEEKKEQMSQDRPKDTVLPGWGTWGGIGAAPAKRRRKRFLIDKKHVPSRRDANLQHVVINEHRDKKIAVHQVNQLPFPFSNSVQFQRSVRAPVGSTWNTPSTVKQLTKPKVTTKLGMVIEPIGAVDSFKKSAQKKRKMPVKH